MSKSIF